MPAARCAMVRHASPLKPGWLALMSVWIAAGVALWAGPARANPVTEPAPPSQTASAASPAASDAAERAALLKKLGAVQAQLSELQAHVRTLEKLTQAPESAATVASVPSSPKSAGPFWTLELLWLSAGAIVAVMFGVSYSRRPSPAKPPSQSVSAQDVAAELQARFGGLDLNLDESRTKVSGSSAIGPTTGRQP